MKNNIHHAQRHFSLRLKGYDYSATGLYFITICTKDRQHYFGKILKGEMILNEIGKTAKMFLEELSGHFKHAMVAEHVVMPNHVHLILVINNKRNFAFDDESMGDGIIHGVGTCHGMSLQATDNGIVGTRHGVSLLFGKPVSGSVSVIINQYKGSLKRWCNNNGYNFFHWQSRFYDHIIRNEKSYDKIVNYINNNPKKWENDKLYLK